MLAHQNRKVIMTREMNKPEWHTGWIFKDAKKTKIIPVVYKWEQPKQRELNPLIAEFVESLNRSLTNVGKR